MNLSRSVGAREARVRRALAHEGLALHKSRSRTVQSVDDLGGYRITDPWTNVIVAGERFDLWLEDLEREWLSS